MKSRDPPLQTTETIATILQTMPGVGEKQIHRLVRLIEDPASWLSLRWAISLPDHDVLHVLLSRWLSCQDEAFVIGCTMGAAKRIKKREKNLYKRIAHTAYHKKYRFSDADLLAYETWFALGKQLPVKNIHTMHLSHHTGRTVNQLREKIWITERGLLNAYAQEIAQIPDSKVSERLKDKLLASSR